MEHVVKNGELLSKIAAGYGITLNRLLAANPRFKAEPDRLAIGDQLLIPTNATESKATSTSEVITDKQTVLDDDFLSYLPGRSPSMPRAWRRRAYTSVEYPMFRAPGQASPLVEVTIWGAGLRMRSPRI